MKDILHLMQDAEAEMPEDSSVALQVSFKTGVSTLIP
jgi:hypothetical protein